MALLEVYISAESLISWGLRTRYEMVALRGERGQGGEGADDEGPGRARAALHAHVWPALRRRGPLAPFDLAAGKPDCSNFTETIVNLIQVVLMSVTLTDDYDSSDGGSDEGGEEEEERAVERAEAFADALGVLSTLAGQRDARLDEHDGLRRERAEQLVAAFCRALGHDLDAC